MLKKTTSRKTDEDSIKRVIDEADDFLEREGIVVEIETKNRAMDQEAASQQQQQSLGVDTFLFEKKQYTDNLWKDKTKLGRFYLLFHYIIKLLIFFIPLLEFLIVGLAVAISFYSFEERGNGDMNMALDYSLAVWLGVTLPILLLRFLRWYNSAERHTESGSHLVIYWIGPNSLVDMFILLVYILILMIETGVTYEIRKECEAIDSWCNFINQSLKGIKQG